MSPEVESGVVVGASKLTEEYAVLAQFGVPPIHNPERAPQRAPGRQYQSLPTPTHSLLGFGAAAQATDDYEGDERQIIPKAL